MDQPPPELIEHLGPWAAYGLMILASLLVIARTIAPEAFKAFVERLRFSAEERAKDRGHLRELEMEAFASERDEEIALVSQTTLVLTQALKQNETLITFITNNIDNRLGDIQEELQAVEQRWLAMSKEMAQYRGEHQIVKIELANLSRVIESVDVRIASLGSFAEEVNRMRRGD
jgi:hypothetical protein